jgi:hypothetical protein
MTSKTSGALLVQPLSRKTADLCEGAVRRSTWQPCRRATAREELRRGTGPDQDRRGHSAGAITARDRIEGRERQSINEARPPPMRRSNLPCVIPAHADVRYTERGDGTPTGRRRDCPAISIANLGGDLRFRKRWAPPAGRPPELRRR